jgi:hypothetical protein
MELVAWTVIGGGDYVSSATNCMAKNSQQPHDQHTNKIEPHHIRCWKWQQVCAVEIL